MKSTKHRFKIQFEPGLVWLSWLEHHPTVKGLRVWFPVRVHAQVTSPIPGLGAYGGQPIDVSLTLMFLFLPSSLLSP